MTVHLDFIYVKFQGQDRRLKFMATGGRAILACLGPARPTGPPWGRGLGGGHHSLKMSKSCMGPGSEQVGQRSQIQTEHRISFCRYLLTLTETNLSCYLASENYTVIYAYFTRWKIMHGLFGASEAWGPWARTRWIRWPIVQSRHTDRRTPELDDAKARTRRIGTIG